MEGQLAVKVGKEAQGDIPQLVGDAVIDVVLRSQALLVSDLPIDWSGSI